MKNNKKTIYLRYEFSDETGTLEGGDVVRYDSLEDIQEIISQIAEIAHEDGVAVNLTIGKEKPFFGFLKNVGLSRQEVEAEMVDQEEAPAPQKAPKKTSKKTAKKK